jgi:hypothetical protein
VTESKYLKLHCAVSFILSAGFHYLTCFESLLIIGSYSEIEVFREALEHMTAILNIVSYKLDMVISRPMQASNTSHYSLFRPSCKGGLSYPLNQGWFFPDVFPFHEALEIPCR